MNLRPLAERSSLRRQCDAQKKQKKEEVVLPPGWQAFVDVESGEAYYHNALSGKTQWKLPRESIQKKKEKNNKKRGAPAAAAVGSTPGALGPLAPIWEATVDLASGKPYYFNRTTGETQWEPPGRPSSGKGWRPMTSSATAKR
jgi:hypothetical protein